MAHTLPPATAADEILILLDESPSGGLRVRAVELSISAVKVRFGAANAPGLDMAFRPEVGGIVRSICDGAAHAPGPVERPDFRLRLPGLILDGYAIAAAADPDGTRSFRLRIRRAAGNALAIFRNSANADAGLALFTPRIIAGPTDQQGSERLFDEMLSQLYLPLVNLNAYLRHMLDGSAPGRGESLSNSVVQLKTRAETLQFAFDRLIADMMVDKYAGGPARQVSMPDSTAA